LPPRTAPNKFAAQRSLDAIAAVSAGLRGVAVALMKVANDIRGVASGPRAGLHELRLPANEPGSSIMPRNAKPTHRDAMVMVCLQGIAADSIGAAGAQGNFERNAMRPTSSTTSSTPPASLATPYDELRLVRRERAARPRPGRGPRRTVAVLVTALSRQIGYDKAAAIAHKADDNGTTLREAALTLDVRAAAVDRIVDATTMVGDPHRDLGLATRTAAPSRP